MNTTENYIVFFDGVCNLCNSTVDFLIRYNTYENLKFSSLQSEFAKQFLAKFNITTTQLSTICFFENGEIFQKSDAALAIAQHLSAPFNWIRFFSFLPAGFRNFLYSFVARNRYRFFGQRDTCRIATAKEKVRFLED